MELTGKRFWILGLQLIVIVSILSCTTKKISSPVALGNIFTPAFFQTEEYLSVIDYLGKNLCWECNLNSVWFLFLLNHNKYNFFFLDLQMLLKVVFGCVQGRRRMSRLYTLAHIRELPFLCV